MNTLQYKWEQRSIEHRFSMEFAVELKTWRHVISQHEQHKLMCISFRYIDDVLSVYITLFCGFLVSIYPNELDIKHITDLLKVPSRYIDLYLKIVDESRIRFKLNDKRDYFPI
jgi:hypothetical protein